MEPRTPKLALVGQILTAAGTIIMCLLGLAVVGVLAWIFFG